MSGLPAVTPDPWCSTRFWLEKTSLPCRAGCGGRWNNVRQRRILCMWGKMQRSPNGSEQRRSERDRTQRAFLLRQRRARRQATNIDRHSWGSGIPRGADLEKNSVERSARLSRSDRERVTHKLRRELKNSPTALAQNNARERTLAKCIPFLLTHTPLERKSRKFTIGFILSFRFHNRWWANKHGYGNMTGNNTCSGAIITIRSYN